MSCSCVVPLRAVKSSSLGRLVRALEGRHVRTLRSRNAGRSGSSSEIASCRRGSSGTKGLTFKTWSSSERFDPLRGRDHDHPPSIPSFSALMPRRALARLTVLQERAAASTSALTCFAGTGPSASSSFRKFSASTPEDVSAAPAASAASASSAVIRDGFLFPFDARCDDPLSQISDHRLLQSEG